MVKSVLCYLDNTGKIHRNAADAHRADLQDWFQSSGTINEAGAAALAKRVVDDRETLFELTSMLEAVARDTAGAE